jgi:hypothetical protein
MNNQNYLAASGACTHPSSIEAAEEDGELLKQRPDVHCDATAC